MTRLRRGFTLLEVLLVVALVAVVLTLISGLVISARNGVREGERIINWSQSARTALDRITGDLRSAVYYGPAARYAVGLEGQAVDHPEGSGGGDRLVMVIAALPRGLATSPLDDDDEDVQRGRSDLRVVTYEIQTDDSGHSRLVRLEQGVLDAVNSGEVTAEVVCEDVEQFHLQYYGKVPQGADGLQAGSALAGNGEWQWLHDWKTGIKQDAAGSSGDSAGTATSAGAAGTAAAATGAATGTAQPPPEYAMPAAVQIILVLKDTRDRKPAGPPEDFPADRWFETIVCPAGPPETGGSVTDIAKAAAGGGQTGGSIQSATAGQSGNTKNGSGNTKNGTGGLPSGTGGLPSGGLPSGTGGLPSGTGGLPPGGLPSGGRGR